MRLRPSRHSFVLFLVHLVSLSFCLAVRAAPSGATQYESTVHRPNVDLISEPTTVTTVTQTNTSMGPATEICKITLTPVTVNGMSEVQEVKKCTFTLNKPTGVTGGGAGSGSQGGSNGSSGGSTGATTTTATIASSISSSAAPTMSMANSTSTSSTSSTSSSANTTVTTNPAVTVNGLSSVPAAIPSPTSSSTSGTTSSAAAASTPTSAPDTAASSSAAAAASASASSASAAAANASSQAAFTLPGKKLSVLPIGLGVFAGVSVIALIVVGLVTYERTKYRKAFRQRKLAESGQDMGYGGMAERT